MIKTLSVILFCSLFSILLTIKGFLSCMGLGTLILVSGIAIFKFETFLLLFIICRPALDTFLQTGIKLNFSRINIASLFSIIFLIASIINIFRKKDSLLPSFREALFFFLFLIFAGISTFYNFNIVQWDGIFSFLRWVTILNIILITSKYDTINKRARLIQASLCSLIFPLLYSIAQLLFRFNLNTGEGFDRINGGFAHSNVFALYLGIFFILIYTLICVNKTIPHKNNFYLSSLAITLLVCLFFTYARGVWLSLCFSLLCINLFCFSKRQFFHFLLLILVIITADFLFFDASFKNTISNRFADVNLLTDNHVFSTTSNSLGWRIAYWKELLLKASQSPFLGWGFGSVIHLGSAHMEAHNNYVQLFFETGIGCLFYGICLLLFFQRAIKGIKSNDAEQKFIAVNAFGLIIFYLTLSLSAHLTRNTVSNIYIFLFLSLLIPIKPKKEKEITL